MPEITFTFEDKFGKRAVAVFYGDLIPCDIHTNMDSFRPVDIRQFMICGKDYVLEWLAPGELTGVKP
jgi:hypothetical protein